MFPENYHILIIVCK